MEILKNGKCHYLTLSFFIFSVISVTVNMDLKEFAPKLLVFDLDYTLWPFYVDTHVSPPFKLNAEGKIVDSLNKRVPNYYKEVPELLELFSKQGYILAAASRTAEVMGANQLLEIFGLNKYFKYKEIFPGRKTIHIGKISRASGVPLEEIIFFDDEDRNIRDVSGEGVMSVLVRNGVSIKLVNDSIEEYKRRRRMNTF